MTNNKKYLVLILLSLCFASCEEYSKNKTRDDLGHCIPEGKKAVVEYKWTTERGENFRVQYRILEDDSECYGLITVHDYRLIKEGDTLTSKSASEKCFKIYGEPCEDAIWSDIKVAVVIILIIASLYGLYFLANHFLGDLIRESALADIWYIIKDLVEDIIHVRFGVIGWFTMFFIAQSILGLIIWEFFQEVEPGKTSFIQLLKYNAIVTAFSALMMLLIGGFSRLHKNMMVLSIGAILLGGLMLFSHHVLGLKFTYMVEHAMKSMSSD